MMQARCPACRTVFRVRPEQLRARQGLVRCGHCQTPFNALEHLLDEELPEDAGAPVSAPPAGASPRTSPTERFFILEETPPPPPAEAAPEEPAAGEARRAEPLPSTLASLADRLDFDIPESLLPARKPPAEPSVATEPVGPAPAVIRPAGRHGAAAEAEPMPEEEETAGPEIPLACPPAAPTAEAAPFAPAAEQAEPQGSGDLAAPADEFGDSAATPPFDADFEAARLDQTYGRRAATPARRWLWGLGVGVLLGLLAAQAAYLFRGAITRAVPELRPAYLVLCDRLGCTVPLPHDASRLGIESSALESEPGGRGRYLLNAVVKNRADFVQAWPHLELTLTDARDLPTVRRIIAPKEWVPPELLAGGFAPHGEQAVRLPFAAQGVDAVGYRIYAFYP